MVLSFFYPYLEAIMKRLLFILFLACANITVFSQNDSIFPNYESVFCLSEGWHFADDTYIFPSDPYTDTLSVMFINEDPFDTSAFQTYAHLC